MNRRPSIAGPLSLIAFGVIALLVQMKEVSASEVWDWYLRWWPMLLIVIGAISLAEWWVDRGDPRVRRRHYGWLVVLLILLVLFGHAARGLGRWGSFENLGQDDPLFHFLGQERRADHALNREIPSQASIRIEVPHGDVTVTPSADDRIHVEAHAVVYASNDTDAQSAFAALGPELIVNGKVVTLRSGDPARGRTDLTIEIPLDAVAAVRAGHGDVTIADLKTPVDVTDGRGNVKFDNLGAGALVRMARGDVTAHSIGGDFSLDGRLNDVEASDVRGKALLDGDSFGDIHLSRVNGAVQVHSRRTEIEAAALPGELSLDSGDLEVDRAAGPIRIVAKAKDIRGTALSGELYVENVDGQISLSTAGPPAPTQIENRNGEVRLSLPSNGGFLLEATAKHGSIHSQFDLPVTRLRNEQELSGVVQGGGDKIELTTDHGDIHIERAGLTAETRPPAASSGPSAFFRETSPIRRFSGALRSPAALRRAIPPRRALARE